MTKLFGLLAVAASFAVSALALPMDPESTTSIIKPRTGEGEPFQCPDQAAAKKAKAKLISYGANARDLAIATLENGCAFKANFNAGNGKSGDNAELGIYRNNWYMIRTYCDDFKGATTDEWYSRGHEIQDDVKKATKCQHKLWKTLGATQYYGLQRGGLSNMGAGHAYGQYVDKYTKFYSTKKGKNMHNGMGIYWEVPSM